MQTQILNPENVYAYRIGNEPQVILVATGHEDGYTNFRIVESPAEIVPPIYQVEADQSIIIGYFPYTVRQLINYPTTFDYISFQKEGTQRIPITPLDGSQANLEATAQPGQVVGYAYNSSDINVAIQDAIAKLRKLNAGGQVSAEVVSSGFVAAGSPVGIAFFYVVMQQKA